MDQTLDKEIGCGYRSASQVSRVVSEDWVARNMFCPVCGAPVLHHYPANRPVADFFCDSCGADFELKSYNSSAVKVRLTIPDGAYDTMIERITSLNNPNLLVLSYADMKVNGLMLIPKFFFTPGIIEKRSPLKGGARRAAWTKCNIGIGGIPEIGKIVIVEGGEERPRADVVGQYQKVLRLKTSALERRGWMFDVIQCVERVPGEDFCLKDIYAFADELRARHPDNSFVRDKIRQQLQYLRDKGFIEFTSRGHYKKIGL